MRLKEAEVGAIVYLKRHRNVQNPTKYIIHIVDIPNRKAYITPFGKGGAPQPVELRKLLVIPIKTRIPVFTESNFFEGEENE